MIGYSQGSELDELDLAILRTLQDDGRISNADLAQRINLSPPATHAHVRRLTERGYIRGYVALLDKAKLGYDMTCFISVSLQMHQVEGLEAFAPACASFPRCWNAITSPASSIFCSRRWCATGRTWSASWSTG